MSTIFHTINIEKPSDIIRRLRNTKSLFIIDDHITAGDLSLNDISYIENKMKETNIEIITYSLLGEKKIICEENEENEINENLKNRNSKKVQKTSTHSRKTPLNSRKNSSHLKKTLQAMKNVQLYDILEKYKSLTPPYLKIGSPCILKSKQFEEFALRKIIDFSKIETLIIFSKSINKKFSDFLYSHFFDFNSELNKLKRNSKKVESVAEIEKMVKNNINIHFFIQEIDKITEKCLEELNSQEIKIENNEIEDSSNCISSDFFTIEDENKAEDLSNDIKEIFLPEKNGNNLETISIRTLLNNLFVYLKQKGLQTQKNLMLFSNPKVINILVCCIKYYILEKYPNVENNFEEINNSYFDIYNILRKSEEFLSFLENFVDYYFLLRKELFYCKKIAKENPVAGIKIGHEKMDIKYFMNNDIMNQNKVETFADSFLGQDENPTKKNCIFYNQEFRDFIEKNLKKENNFDFDYEEYKKISSSQTLNNTMTVIKKLYENNFIYLEKALIKKEFDVLEIDNGENEEVDINFFDINKKNIANTTKNSNPNNIYLGHGTSRKKRGELIFKQKCTYTLPSFFGENKIFSSIKTNKKEAIQDCSIQTLNYLIEMGYIDKNYNPTLKIFNLKFFENLQTVIFKDFDICTENQKLESDDIQIILKNRKIVLSRTNAPAKAALNELLKKETKVKEFKKFLNFDFTKINKICYCMISNKCLKSTEIHISTITLESTIGYLRNIFINVNSGSFIKHYTIESAKSDDFSPLKNIEYIPRLLKEKKRGEKIFAEIFVDITNKTECFDYFNDIDDRIKFVEKSSSILIDSFNLKTSAHLHLNGVALFEQSNISSHTKKKLCAVNFTKEEIKYLEVINFFIFSSNSQKQGDFTDLKYNYLVVPLVVQEGKVYLEVVALFKMFTDIYSETKIDIKNFRHVSSILENSKEATKEEICLNILRKSNLSFLDVPQKIQKNSYLKKKSFDDVLFKILNFQNTEEEKDLADIENKNENGKPLMASFYISKPNAWFLEIAQNICSVGLKSKTTITPNFESTKIKDQVIHMLNLAKSYEVCEMFYGKNLEFYGTTQYIPKDCKSEKKRSTIRKKTKKTFFKSKPKKIKKIDTDSLISDSFSSFISVDTNYDFSRLLDLTCIALTRQFSKNSYEKLEFIGDTVLKHLVSKNMAVIFLEMMSTVRKKKDYHKEDLNISEDKFNPIKFIISSKCKFVCNKTLEIKLKALNIDNLVSDHIRIVPPKLYDVKSFSRDKILENCNNELLKNFIKDNYEIESSELTDFFGLSMLTKFIPNMHLGRKTYSDIAEAMIGAFFLDNGLDAAGKICSKFGLTDEDNRKRMETSLKQNILMDFDHLEFVGEKRKDLHNLFIFNGILPSEEIKKVEKILNYEFKNKGNLEKALIHPSLGLEFKGPTFDFLDKDDEFCTNYCAYEFLEFIGDEILDLIIIEDLFKEKGVYPYVTQEEEIKNLTNIPDTSFKSSSKKYKEKKCRDINDFDPKDFHFYKVNRLSNKALGMVLMKTGLHEFVKINISVEEIELNINKGYKDFIENIEGEYEEGSNWLNKKKFGDMFEGIIGAVYLDCGFNREIISDKLSHIFDIIKYKRY